MTRLADIVESKRREIHQMRHRTCYTRVPDGPRGSVARTLRRGPGEPLRLIAENKRKSPSAGPLSTVLSPAERAVRYAQSGASMVSVLCDEPFFAGSWEDVVETRRALEGVGSTIPVLAKEFILDERQLREASACGADAVLLIARILDPIKLRELHVQAMSLGLEPIVEVVTEAELRAALDAGARVVGVNARDLDTFVIDADRAARVLAAIPESCVSVHLSGIKGAADVRELSASGAHAALIGETLMRQDDPEPLLREMVEAAQI